MHNHLKHEFRTPLNHIIGYCEMLLEETADLPELGFAADLETIHACGRRLVNVVNDLFDPVKSAHFASEPNRMETELRAPLHQVIRLAETLREQTGPRGAEDFAADFEKIAAAARNLLRLVDANLTGAKSELTPASREVSPSSTILIRRLQENSALSSAARSSILVVDDDQANREMLGRRLVRLGFDVTRAENGRRALEILREKKFDLMLLDIQMPVLNGYEVLQQCKGDPSLRDIPVIVLSASDETESVARAIELGAEDYLPKPFDPVLLQARLGASLEKKRLRDKERQTYEALVASEKRLAAELAEAAIYVQSLLPGPLESPVKVHWRFQPSAELGGDCFGYHWVTPEKLAIYLLDVSGHGVGAALLSVSVLNLIRGESLAGAHFCDPASVLRGLNRVFQMERHNNLIFTIWYGVFDASSRQLAYASGGHPPAVLLEPQADGSLSIQTLSTGGPVLGCDPAAEYRCDSCAVPRGSRLYVLSDGAYEIAGPDGRTRQWPEFLQQLATPAHGAVSKLDLLVDWAKNIRGDAPFEDDLSLMELEL